MISFVVAASENNVIGLNGKLPWNLPADLKHFKNITWGFPIIMGRKTFDSLKHALPGRKNIVISRTDQQRINAISVQTVQNAILEAKQCKTKEIFVIGGDEIFNLFKQKVERIYLTRIHTICKGDTFFKLLVNKNWHCVLDQFFKADDSNLYDYRFQIWEKK